MSKKKFFKLCITCTLGISLFFTSKVDAALVDTKRLSGIDRYRTCSQIVNEGWKNSDYAIVVNGENFPDALSASVLAKKYNAPILITKSNILDINTLDQLKRLNVKKVFIAGGESSVNNSVELAIRKLGVQTVRYSGKDRNETSVKIAEQIGTDNGIIITTDNYFTDALSVAPIAGKLQIPIILVPKDTLPESVKNFIIDRSIPKTYVLGGTDIISDTVALRFPSVQRVDGDDKYERNINIINTFSDKLDFSTSFVLSGEDYPDGIASTALAATTSSPIILMKNSLSSNSYNFLKNNLSKISNLYILGGQSVMAEELFSEDNLSIRGNSTGNIVNNAFVAKQGDWIYYWNQKDYSLCKEKIDGSNYTLLYPDGPKYINVVGDWIYYSNELDGNKLYKIKTDGTNRTKLTEEMSKEINVVDDWIYFQDNSGTELQKWDTLDSGRIFKMKTDGTNKQRISDDYSSNICVVGKSMYYSNHSDNKKLYKIDLTTLNKTKLSDDSVNYINVVNNWIYYYGSSGDNFSDIYKIKLDGSNKIRLSKPNGEPTYASNLYVDSENIYYLNVGGYGTNSIYKMDFDGKHRSKIIDNVGVNFNMLGDKIFFLNQLDHNSIYFANNDGSNPKLFDNPISNNEDTTVSNPNLRGNTLGNIQNDGFFAEQCNWVYFAKPGLSGYSLYKMKKDGTCLSKISNDDPKFINVIGSWIYYRNETDNGCLYKIKTSGIEKTKLNDSGSRYINVIGDWIYYTSDSDGFLYKIKTDGTNKIRLTNYLVNSVNVEGDWIYYIKQASFLGNGYITKMKIDGTDETIISNNYDFYSPVLDNGWIYYSNLDCGLNKIKTDGTCNTSLQSSDNPFFINVYNGYIYYSNANPIDKGSIYRIKVDGSNREKINDNGVYSIQVINNKIFYEVSDNYGYAFYSMNEDGTQKELVK